MKILIKNGRVFDGEKFTYADILTDDAVILKIAPDINESGLNYTFDAKGLLVAPGLVDSHVHMRGTEPDRYGIQPELSSIPFGVTAVADAGGAHASGELVATYLLKSVTFVQVPIKGNRADFTITEKKLALYGEKAIGLKVYYDRSNPEILDIAPLQTVCAYAREQGLKVMVHCTDSPVPMQEILETLAPGDILTHAFHGGRSTAKEDDFASMLAAKERGICIDAGFAGHIHTDFSIFREAVCRGILPDTISTDITRASAYKRGGRYGMTMAMSMARTAGMTEEQVLRASTVTPAKVLGKEGAWGVLREGGCADLCVLDYGDYGYSLTDKAGNTLADTKGYRCILTMADGVIVWRD